MAAVLPQVRVFQEFNVNVAAVANPLRAHIAGGHAFLIRFEEADERAQGRLGYYDRLADTSYLWPNRPAGSVVDQSFVKLFMKNALLKYFDDSIGAGDTITKVSGYNNRIRAAATSFVENGEDYPRDADLLRDVKKGDVAKVRGVDGSGDPHTLWTTVRAIHGDVVASVVDAPDADDDNATSRSASSSIEQTAGAVNCVTASVSHAAYDGLKDGDIDETYSILVLEGSSNGDFTTAKLRVISGSGRDDVASVTPAAAGSPTAIGTRGLTVTFNHTPGAGCSDSAEEDAVSAVDLIPGQRFEATVAQAFTAPTVTAGGDYSGTSDATYVVEVVRGGRYGADLAADQPQIRVTTTNGSDRSGPTNITTSGSAVDIGTKDVTLTFTSGQLRKGDKWYVAATAEGQGPMRVIELANSLDSGIAAGSQVDLTLFILKPSLEISKNRIDFAPQVNFETSATEIDVKEGIIAYDSTWANDAGQQPLDVWAEETEEYGELYVEYRAWLADLADRVGTIATTDDLDSEISGPLDPDNPLKYGVFKALQNANGTEVKFSAVADPSDADSWASMLGKLVGRDDVYSLVPLTRDQTVLDLYQAHTESQSSAEQALWRVAWFSLTGMPTIPILAASSDVPGHSLATTSDGEEALATVVDDPQTSGTQYTLLRLTSANAKFDALGVRGGDIVRISYVGDGFGGETYDEYVVDAVLSDDEIRLASGPDAAINVAVKFEIWRTLTAAEEAAEIGKVAGAWSNRRIRCVWPDTIESSSDSLEGWFLCCALAGLSSGIVPHQGMTHLEIAGFTSTQRTSDKFNRTQLDEMAGSGVWIVMQDPKSGRIYTRHAVTTAPYDDLDKREEMVTRNVDSISYRFKDWFAPYIGVCNVTESMQARLEQEVVKLVDTLKQESFTVTLGAQLRDATLLYLKESALFADRYVAAITLVVPKALNNFDIHLSL